MSCVLTQKKTESSSAEQENADVQEETDVENQSEEEASDVEQDGVDVQPEEEVVQEDTDEEPVTEKTPEELEEEKRQRLLRVGDSVNTILSRFDLYNTSNENLETFTRNLNRAQSEESRSRGKARKRSRKGRKDGDD